MKNSNMNTKNKIWLLLSFSFLILILYLPTPEGLPVVGQRALAILVFAVLMWVSEALSYIVSAFIILVLISLIIGFSPDLNNEIYGTRAALKIALGGFSAPPTALVAAATFIAIAMESTQLHKRLALIIMSKVGSETNRLVIGTILVSIVLAFIVPSATARAGTVIPILIGMVTAFGLTHQSKLATLLTITAVQAVSIWNVGIKTAAAQNMVAIGFIEEQFHINVSWGEWLVYAAPWSIIMSILLYFIMTRLFKSENHTSHNDQNSIQLKLAELGQLKLNEKKLIVFSIALLFFWSTEKILHNIDNTTITLVAIALMLMPKIGIFTWNEITNKIPWNTLIVFAVSISLGMLLLQSQGANWLSQTIFDNLGITHMPLLSIIAILSLFNIIIHLGFASATSLASVLIPIVIALTDTIPTSINNVGFVLIQQFVISFGFLLPVNAPQNMLAYGMGIFSIKNFLKSGLIITIASYLLILLFSMTYWKWIGLL